MDAVKHDDIDPQGYGIDLERCVRRMGYKNGEQTVFSRRRRIVRMPNGKGYTKQSSRAST